MKKNITIVTIFFLFSFASAQEKLPTVEEIYAKHLETIGGNEKLTNISNRLEVSSISSEYVTQGAVNNQGTNKQEIITFWDYVSSQSATITKQFPSALNGDKINISRIFTANGQTTLLLSDGKKHITPADNVEEHLKSPFSETIIPSESKLLPNETFNGKEVYVVYYEKMLMGIPFNYYAYFDTQSGLLIGLKQIGKTESYGSITTTTTLIKYENYKEVNGILISHKTEIESKSEITGSVSMISVTNMIVEVIATEFNVNTEDFKQNCFQKPEECFTRYIKN